MYLKTCSISLIDQEGGFLGCGNEWLIGVKVLEKFAPSIFRVEVEMYQVPPIWRHTNTKLETITFKKRRDLIIHLRQNLKSQADIARKEN